MAIALALAVVFAIAMPLAMTLAPALAMAVATPMAMPIALARVFSVAMALPLGDARKDFFLDFSAFFVGPFPKIFGLKKFLYVISGRHQKLYAKRCFALDYFPVNAFGKCPRRPQQIRSEHPVFRPFSNLFSIFRPFSQTFVLFRAFGGLKRRGSESSRKKDFSRPKKLWKSL